MKLSKEQKSAMYFFFIGLFIVVLVFVPAKDKSVVNCISVLGSYMSIFGLAVVYIQISSVKDISEITNVKVDETQDRITQLISMIHIAKGVSTLKVDSF